MNLPQEKMQRNWQICRNGEFFGEKCGKKINNIFALLLIFKCKYDILYTIYKCGAEKCSVRRKIKLQL